MIDTTARRGNGGYATDFNGTKSRQPLDDDDNAINYAELNDEFGGVSVSGKLSSDPVDGAPPAINKWSADVSDALLFWRKNFLIC